MTAFNYDELKISTSDTPLSVERWNGLVDQLSRVEQTLNRIHLSDAENGRIGIGVSPERALHIEGTGGANDDVFLHSSGSRDSAALIFAKSSPNHTPVKKGNLLGFIAFRGETGEGFSGDSSIRSYALTDFKGKSSAASDLRFYTIVNGKIQENLRLEESRKTLAFGDLEVRGSTELKKELKVLGSTVVQKNLAVQGSAGVKGNTTVNGKLTVGGTVHVKGQLTIQNTSNSRGWIVMRSQANNNAAKTLLKSIENQQLVIGGVWDDYVYFYWKNEDGKIRRAMIKGGSF